ncbi:MAG TPA: hypothetical protein ENK55_07070, partial [Actinobacteria bacterium]|nr:hypothetical protein [Actinomycetota bacterium]
MPRLPGGASGARRGRRGLRRLRRHLRRRQLPGSARRRRGVPRRAGSRRTQLPLRRGRGLDGRLRLRGPRAPRDLLRRPGRDRRREDLGSDELRAPRPHPRRRHPRQGGRVGPHRRGREPLRSATGSISGPRLEEEPVPTEADHRLPRTVVPSRYRLRLAPDLDAARFDGEVAVDVEVVEEVDAVVVNAADLEIHDAALVAPDGERIGASITLDADRERAVFRLDRPVAPGAWTLEASFTGILNDELRGFYRSVYRDAEGNEKVVA